MSAPTSMAANCGRRRSSTSGRPGSALPWWGTFIASTSGGARAAGGLALGVGADSQRSKSPALTIATTPRGFGSSGGGGRAAAAAATRTRSGGARRAAPDRRAPGRCGCRARRASSIRRLKPGSRVPSPPSSSRPSRDAVDHLVEAALVVARLVRGHHQVEPRTPARRSCRVHARLGRTAVEQDGGAVAVLDERGVALPDVEEADRQSSGGAGVASTAPRRGRARSRRATAARRREDARGPRRQAAASSSARPRGVAARRAGDRVRRRAACSRRAHRRRAARRASRGPYASAAIAAYAATTAAVSPAAAQAPAGQGRRSARRGRRGRRAARA